MNVGRYLRGEDLHVGTSRITKPKELRMNERIKELKQQAGDYVNETYTGPVRSKTPGKIWEDGHIGWHDQFHTKFAELIIRECADIALKKGMASPDTDFRTGSILLSEYLLVRFGVEE